MANSVSVQRFAEFMDEWRDAWHEQKESWRVSCERFNIFDALGIETKELVHSAFLKYLLDPSGKHDQGPLFLKGFLQMIAQFPNDSTDPELTMACAKACVSSEEAIGTNGRLDLLIRLPDRRLIVVENKVYAGEGDNQIGRYQTWLSKQHSPDNGRHVVVFLTPTGRKPLTAAHQISEVLIASYSDIVHWLTICLEQTKLDRSNVFVKTINMYCNVCRELSGAPDE